MTQPRVTKNTEEPKFFTIGHSTQSLEELVEALQAHGVRALVDVRKLTGSRSQPQFNDSELATYLPAKGIEYLQLAELGGLRGKSHEVPRETNDWWQNDSFHNYADYALSAPFQKGIEKLLKIGVEKPVAVMCAEAVWWRCHRRIIADYLIAHHQDVVHLLPNSRSSPAAMSEGALSHANGTVTYPPKD